MKKQPKFEKGDVVLIEYKPIKPTVPSMCEYDFSIGIIKDEDSKSPEVCFEKTGYSLWWPTECLTLISKSDFK